MKLPGKFYIDFIWNVFSPLQATRNTGAAIAGENVANPSAMLLASSLMLEHLGLTKHAELISNAVNKVLNVKQVGCM